MTLLGVNRARRRRRSRPTPTLGLDRGDVDIRDLAVRGRDRRGVAGRTARRGTEAGDDGPRRPRRPSPLFFRAPRRAGATSASVVVVLRRRSSDVERQRRARSARRILVAGGVALLARAARRRTCVAARRWAAASKRLERAARRVAAGRLLARASPVDGDDELGQLARGARRHAAPARRARRARASGFIATASHELRTPIFSLGGFLELLEDEELDEETRRAFIAASCASRSTASRKLATDLLDLSRLEAGSLELRPEPTDVGDARPATVAAEFAPALAAHGSASRAAPGGEPAPTPTCDPERVAQILRILIDNALSAHAAGHRRRRRGGAPRRARAARGDRTSAAASSAHDLPRDLRALLHLRRRPRLGPRAWPSRASSPSAWTAS